ncbi:MAG: CHAT domain-containing protein [Calothrix sp. FI2-JRJ7]|jgi:CHAT domain-containing protein|nr:CHAT domain-containing protein [Calothrix sp. FI2-JRJ7]
MTSKIFLVLFGIILSLGIHLFPIDIVSANTKIVQTPVLEKMQQGKTLYQAGQFADAASHLKQVARAYELQGDFSNEALALNYLSLTQQKLGDWNGASESVTNSLNILNKLNLNSHDSKHVLALAFNTQGSLLLARGETEKAIESWQKAVNIYTEINDDTGRIGSLINKANAYQALGFYRRSVSVFESVEKDLLSSANSPLKVAGLRSLGNVLQATGKFDESQKMLKQSLIAAQQLQSASEESATLLSLGNLYLAKAKTKLPLNNAFHQNYTPLRCNAITAISDNAKKDYAQSLDFYQKSLNKSTSKITKVQVQLNILSVPPELRQKPITQEIAAIKSEITTLTPSRAAVYAKVKFARNLACLNPSLLTPNSFPPEIIELLKGAVQQSQELKDARALSFALGNLGQMYELQKEYNLAKQYTESALTLAQSINAPDITYQWQWQLGRLNYLQNNISAATAAYQNAVTTLKSIRNDLVSLSTEAQFDFRDEVEPVYRQLVSLLLNQDASGKVNQKNLIQARDVIEALQLAELDNFFRDACNIVQQTPIDEIVDNANPATAVFYPIILANRIEVIVKLPKQKDLLHYTTQTSNQVEDDLETFLKQLQQSYTRKERNQLALKIYNWIIKGAEKDLERLQVKNLVFVLDGALRNIPMAALYDGKQYLIEKYSVALSPGLRLIEPNAKKRRFEALAGGLTKSVENFPALTNVENEIKKIKSIFPSTSLLNQEFTNANIEQKISSDAYEVVHLATHGQFSSQLGNTFILAWNDRIDIKELRGILQTREQIVGRSSNVPNPIELLVLSACQTATGDRRAALGLAGVAVRSGARSTLASLWSVGDESTADLMGKFYEELANNPDITKSKALQLAQQYILQKKPHPRYWAPYVLIGNWL